MKHISVRRLARSLGVSNTALIKWRDKFIKPLSTLKTNSGSYDTLTPEGISLLFVIKQLRFYNMPVKLIETMLERLDDAFSFPVEKGKKIMLLLAKLPRPEEEVLYVNVVIDTEENITDSMNRLEMDNRVYDITELLDRIKNDNLSSLGKTIDWDVA